MSSIERTCFVCGLKGHGADECERGQIAPRERNLELKLELPTYKNGTIVGAHWYTCKIHSQGLPVDQSAGRTICCASADRRDRALTEASTEIGSCTVTWDADEAEVARSLLHGESTALMQRMGFRKFYEVKERVFKKFNQAVVANLPRDARISYLEST